MRDRRQGAAFGRESQRFIEPRLRGIRSPAEPEVFGTANQSRCSSLRITREPGRLLEHLACSCEAAAQPSAFSRGGEIVGDVVVSTQGRLRPVPRSAVGLTFVVERLSQRGMRTTSL